LLPLLEAARPLWQNQSAYFYADSASSAVKYLQPINSEGWQWSVSYNKWTSVLERQAQSWPQAQWTDRTIVEWENGEKLLEQYTWIKHQPENAAEPIVFAVVRSKEEKSFSGVPRSWPVTVDGKARPKRSLNDITSKDIRSSSSARC
jgi:hypothetical protein